VTLTRNGPRNYLADLIISITTLITNVTVAALNILAVKAVTDAVGVVGEQGGVIASQAAEVDVYINNAPAGIFRPGPIKIDFTNQQAGETIRIREYYRIAPGGNLILEDEVNYVGVQAPALIPIELSKNRYGVRLTMERTAGVQRNYPYEVFVEE